MAEASTTRNQGLMLIGVGALTFVGTTTQLLPAVAFFPATAVCLLGIFVFIRGNRVVSEQEERRLKRALDPNIRNRTAERYADQQAGVDGRTLASVAHRDVRSSPAERIEPIALAEDEIMLSEVSSPGEAKSEDDFQVSTDVSFPVELQQTQSLAEQLQKLQRLHEDGVISAEEFSIAKAKLLA